MQAFQPFLSNLKSQSVVTLILAALAGYVANSVWYYIPAISNIYWAGNPPAIDFAFMMTAWAIINSLINTVGLAALLSKKGALTGFGLGALVTVFFSMSGFVASYVGQQFPPASVIVVIFIGTLLFYAVPATLLGHLRKN